MLAPNTNLQNRYLVMRELGHGGMGTVYEVLDQRVNCIVALKETIAGKDDEARRAFEREASLLGNLRHSALPKVMDYFTEDDGDFLIMEFIPGYDLAELLELRGGPFPQAQAMRWADELLKVLEYLHGQQPPILHRDIKPSNLKLTKQGEIFLLDFGLAKGSVGQMPTLAAMRSVRGYTPVYASLEQIHGHGTDARSDIYSLGATLYHLLTGIAPIDAPARFQAIEDDRPDPLQPIEKLNSQASPNIAAVIHQAMAISRKQRPISAAEMRRALRNAAEEDERHSAEEEYAWAEERRREREEERKKGSEKEAKRAEKQRRLQEVRTQIIEINERLKEIRKQREAEERRAEEEKRLSKERRKQAEEHAGREAVGTIPVPYVPQPPPIDPEITQPATIPVPPVLFWNKRRVAFAVAAPLVIIGIVVISLLYLPPRGQKSTDSVNQQQLTQQPSGTQDKSPTAQKSTQQPGAINDKVEQALSRGNADRDAKHFAQAEKNYRRALLLDSNEPRAYYGLGNVYYDQGRYYESIDQFKKAIEFDSSNAASHYALGLAYLSRP